MPINHDTFLRTHQELHALIQGLPGIIDALERHLEEEPSAPPQQQKVLLEKRLAAALAWVLQDEGLHLGVSMVPVEMEFDTCRGPCRQRMEIPRISIGSFSFFVRGDVEPAAYIRPFVDDADPTASMNIGPTRQEDLSWLALYKPSAHAIRELRHAMHACLAEHRAGQLEQATPVPRVRQRSTRL